MSRHRQHGDLAAGRAAATGALGRAGYELTPGVLVRTPHGPGRVLGRMRERSWEFGQAVWTVWAWVELANGAKVRVLAADAPILEVDSERD